MKIYIFSIIILLIFVSNANAAEKWTKEDISYQVVSNILLLADWKQTRWITKYSEEANPLIGESIGNVNTYFISVLILHNLISHYIPERRTWQLTVICVESVSVGLNIMTGVRIEF